MVEAANNTEKILRERVRQLARLVEISLTLNSTLNPKRLLQYIIDSAAELLDCEAASVMLYDENKGELRFAASSGSDPEQLATIPVPLDNSIAGTIFQQNKPLVINDLAAHPFHFKQVAEEVDLQERSLMGVPMAIKDKVTGVLEGINKRNGEFTEDDVHVLSVVASQAAVAIHNAQLLESLQAAVAELSRMDEIKSDFISIASHELRTPLGLVLGYAELLKQDASGEASDMANRVLNSAMRMRSIIEDMTNMSMLQMGEIDLILDVVPIQEIIQAAYKKEQASAEIKGHTVVFDFPDKKIPVKADTQKLERVFINLINNAVRFTPDGGLITITVTPKSKEVQIDMVDNGVGIPEEFLEKIFQGFFQVEDHMTRTYGGMGIGLNIARGILQLHEGRVWAESDGPDQGAKFSVVLPRA